jgi:hypothetical protein
MDDDSSTDDGCPVGWDTKEQWEAAMKRKEEEEEKKKKKKKKKKKQKKRKQIEEAAEAAAANTTTPDDERKMPAKKSRKHQQAAQTVVAAASTTTSDDDRKMPAKKSKKHQQAAQTNINDDTSSSMFNPYILVRSRFGMVDTVKMPPSGSITVMGVKTSLVQQHFIREEEIDIIYLIDGGTRMLLKNSDTIENVQGVHELYVVFGTEHEYTGAGSYFHVPSSFNPVAATTSVAGDANSTFNEEVMRIPSHFEVTGIFTSAGGYQRCNNPSEITVPKGSQVLYLSDFIIPPQLINCIGAIDDGGREFAKLLLIVKIGESGCFVNAMDKFFNKRTFVCFARQHFVMVLHPHNSADMESSLHLHFAMKKGNAHSEFYSISELDIHDVITHFGRAPNVKLVFGKTNHAKCRFGELDKKGKEGRVYRVRHKWNEQQKGVMKELEIKHGNEDYEMPFMPDIICNARDFSQAVQARKVGMKTEVEVEKVHESLRYGKHLWANGMSSQLEVTTIRSMYPRHDERTIHNRLGSKNNVNGEWFLDGARINPPVEKYTPLFDDQKSVTVSRANVGEDAYKMYTKHDLQRYINVYGTLSYKLAFQLLKSGAMVYDSAKENSVSDLDDFELELLEYLDPVDKTPTKPQVLQNYLKTELLGDDYNDMNEITRIERAVLKASEWMKCIKLNLRNKDTFVAISDDDAIDAFVAIFGDSKRNIALGFIQ